MSLLGNLLWFVCGGFLSGMSWILAGCLWCITIVGIPVGVQCFKMSSLAFMPFGKRIVYRGGAFSFLINIIWFFVSGIELALENLLLGCLLCITVVGIPFGLQFFKIARLALSPFGAAIER